MVDSYAGSLSGGQRKLLEISRALMTDPKLILLDEPAAGVNPALIEEICSLIHRLNQEGLSFLIIEHNMDVIKVADYLIDMGPEGGNKGGTVVVQGSPEQVAAHPQSHTGRFLKQELHR